MTSIVYVPGKGLFQTVEHRYLSRGYVIVCSNEMWTAIL